MAEPGKSVLLADDDMTLREMYAERLKAEGFTVVTAKDGKETLEKIKEDRPNVILLDVMMPEMNGIDVLKKIKADEDTKNIPVIILTALVQDRQKMESMSNGAEDYIIKSETMPGDVVAKVHAALENH